MMDLSPELAVLNDVARRLDGAAIPYMLTGSLAMNYYAQPRMTRDIDLVIAVQLGEVDALAAAFEHGYYISKEAAEDAVRRASLFNVIHNESVVKVDLVVRKPDPYRLMEFSRRRSVQVAGFQVWIVSREDLILSKLVWARPTQSELQLRDVRNLLTSAVEEDYLKHWAGELGVQAELENCRDE